MSMAVDYRPQPMGGMGYAPDRYAQPQFTNPWQATGGPSPGPMYHTSYQQSPTAMENPQLQKSTPMSMGYVSNPAASTLGSELVPSRSYGTAYTTAATSQPAYTATAAARYSPEQVAAPNPYAYDADMSRRSSYQQSGSSRASFSDEMASARGMVAMANGHDITPRNIYGNGNPRGSQDSYGFPTTPSQHSSISSASTYPYYSGSYSGSVDGSSVTDYSSASEDTMGQRTLPAPTQLINGFPPEPQSMMNQFNAKLSPSAQKKHKCKICEKRFTRPSSLQTHMYSHTGEKPFPCDHEGCGRHFSVVSNLRRHKKVHKEENVDPMSGDDE